MSSGKFSNDFDGRFKLAGDGIEWTKEMYRYNNCRWDRVKGEPAGAEEVFKFSRSNMSDNY